MNKIFYNYTIGEYMKAQDVSCKLLDKMAFEIQVDGHKLIIDADDTVGGEDRGPRPKSFMQVALAGCTAMDVISILRKMKVEIDDFKVSVGANLTEEHPKHYSDMKVTYEFWGKELKENIKKLEKAVNLSEERYCGVSYTYKQDMTLSNEIIIHES